MHRNTQAWPSREPKVVCNTRISIFVLKCKEAGQISEKDPSHETPIPPNRIILKTKSDIEWF